MHFREVVIKTGRCFLLLFPVILLSGWKSDDAIAFNAGKNDQDTLKAFIRNEAIGRGINFGNALEAPNEGEWGLTIKETYIQAVADAGFNSVRLPVCWSAHTGRSSPYNIDPVFVSRVDEVVSWCLSRNLAVIITIHHFNELYNFPDDPLYQNMFFSIWKQLALHYLGTNPEKLFFEVLNEPEVNLTPEKWNLLIPRIIDSIRVYDNDRTLIIDAPDYGAHTSLSKLSIPESEDNLIVSTRYYLPWQFAQQGAWWSDWTDLSLYLGTTWRGTFTERDAVLADVAMIRSWSESNNIPVTIGEWGSIMFADNQSRLDWTNFVRRQFDLNGFSWSYFDFGVVFKAYSNAEERWLTGFAEALTGDSETVADGRVSDSLRITPAKPSVSDELIARSYFRIPNSCSNTDSVRITRNGSVIKVKAWHTEHIPQSNTETRCADTVNIGRLSPGTYTLIFDSDYIDKVNSIHYSVFDTIDIVISGAVAVNDDYYDTASVYPVPASDYLKVDNIGTACEYEIYDTQGHLLSSGTTGEGFINTASLMNGGYILCISMDGNKILSKRIIVAR